MASYNNNRALQEQGPVLCTINIPAKTYLVVFIFGYILSNVVFSLLTAITLAILLISILSSYFKFISIKNVILYIMAAVIGFLWGFIPCAYINTNYSHFDETIYNGYGVVNSYPENGSSVTQFRCRMENGELKGKYCRVTLFDNNKHVQIGDRVVFEDAVINYSKPSKMDEGILYNKSYSSERTFLETEIKKIKTDGSAPLYSFFRILHNLRDSMNETLRTNLDKDNYLFVSGIITGNKESGNQEFYNMLTASGLSHVVVVSGMHFTLLMTLMIYILKLSRMNELVICIIGIISSVILALFFGLSQSVIRALFMSIVYMIEDYALTNTQDSLQKVLSTATIMIIINPFVMSDVGFVLSFTSILGIVLFSQKLTFRIRYVSSKILDALAITISANILTFPILILYFGKASLSFALGNLLITPFITLIMLYGMVLLIISSFLTRSINMLFAPLNILLKIILKLISAIASLPFSNIKFIVPPLSIIILFYIMVVLILKIKKSPILFSLLSGIIMIIFAVNITLPHGYIYSGKAEYYSLCGKQSGKVIINSGISTIAADFSDSSEYFDALNVINKKCKGSVDIYIINTPAALNAVEKLSSSIDIAKIIAPDSFFEYPLYYEKLISTGCKLGRISDDTQLKIGNIILTPEGLNGYNISRLRVSRSDENFIINAMPDYITDSAEPVIYTYKNFRYMEFNNIQVPENVLNNKYEGIIQGYL